MEAFLFYTLYPTCMGQLWVRIHAMTMLYRSLLIGSLLGFYGLLIVSLSPPVDVLFSRFFGCGVPPGLFYFFGPMIPCSFLPPLPFVPPSLIATVPFYTSLTCFNHQMQPRLTFSAPFNQSRKKGYSRSPRPNDYFLSFSLLPVPRRC